MRAQAALEVRHARAAAGDPIDPADYRGRLSGAQLDRLRAIFPARVCDWSRRGVGQQPPRGTWLSFGPP